MKTLRLSFSGTENVECFIKDLLCAPELWSHRTIFGAVEIKMRDVDVRVMQEGIFFWLQSRLYPNGIPVESTPEWEGEEYGTTTKEVL